MQKNNKRIRLTFYRQIPGFKQTDSQENICSNCQKLMNWLNGEQYVFFGGKNTTNTNMCINIISMKLTIIVSNKGLLSNKKSTLRVNSVPSKRKISYKEMQGVVEWQVRPMDWLCKPEPRRYADWCLKKLEDHDSSNLNTKPWLTTAPIMLTESWTKSTIVTGSISSINPRSYTSIK